MAKLMQKFQRLRDEMKQLEIKIARYEQRFISEQELAKVLYAMLKVSQGVSILHFSDVEYSTGDPSEEINEEQDDAQKKNTLLAGLSPTPAETSPPPTVVSGPQDAPDTDVPPERTEYILKLKGDYFSILNYLKRLEQLDWQLYWDRFEYKVKNYPEGEVTIWFYTLKPASTVPTLQKQAPENTPSTEAKP